MSSQLSVGMCERLHHGEQDDDELWASTPTLQFLSIKKVSSAQQSSTDRPVDRYRIIISDGVNFVQAMLATQLNDLVEKDMVGKNTIATVERMSCNVIQGKRLVVILGLRVEERNAEKIGNPVPLAAPTDAQTTPAPTGPSPSMNTPSTSAPAQPRAQQQKSAKSDNIFPIEALSPYQNNWTIRARVIQKGDIRQFSNARGDGKLFNVTFMDESGDISGTGFNQVVDELYDKLQEGKVYYISKARVDLAKKKFSNNQYELSLTVNTEIEECHDTAQMPVIKYNFTPLAELENIEKDKNCDVVAVVKDITETSQITTKAGRSLTKRELTLVDQSSYSVKLTLWGKQAEQFQASEQPIIAFKGVKVGDFGGRSLSMVSSSVMAVNPDIPEAHALKGWYMDGGAQSSFHSHTNGMSGAGGGGIRRDEMRTLNDVKMSQIGMSDNPEYFSTRATIMSIKPDNLWYPACPSESCNKKVVESHDGWRCEKCDRSYEKPQYRSRYIISCAVADHSDQVWLQGFNDAGTVIFGMSADDVHDLKERDDTAFNELMLRAQCIPYNFSCRAKQDTWNEQTRIRYGITKIQPLDFAAETRAHVDILKSAWAQ
ncbi:replication factor-a protein [Amylostereum chailletii]|nr:replication factor-a protein [Amylostereum chailletii]